MTMSAIDPAALKIGLELLQSKLDEASVLVNRLMPMLADPEQLDLIDPATPPTEDEWAQLLEALEG